MRGGRTRKAKIRESPDDGDPASMRRRPTKQLVTAASDIVRTVGLALPDVEAATKYDGSPVLRVDGIFMAGLAMHPSAEPETLVVRAGLEERERLVEDAPFAFLKPGPNNESFWFRRWMHRKASHEDAINSQYG